MFLKINNQLCFMSFQNHEKQVVVDLVHNFCVILATPISVSLPNGVHNILWEHDAASTSTPDLRT